MTPTRVPPVVLRELELAQAKIQLAQAAFQLKLVETERDYGFRFGEVVIDADGTVKPVSATGAP